MPHVKLSVFVYQCSSSPACQSHPAASPHLAAVSQPPDGSCMPLQQPPPLLHQGWQPSPSQPVGVPLAAAHSGLAAAHGGLAGVRTASWGAPDTGLQDDILELSQRGVQKFLSRVSRASLYILFKLWAGRTRRSVALQLQLSQAADQRALQQAWRHWLCYLSLRRLKLRVEQQAGGMQGRRQARLVQLALAAWAQLASAVAAARGLAGQLADRRARGLLQRLLCAWRGALAAHRSVTRLRGVSSSAHQPGTYLPRPPSYPPSVSTARHALPTCPIPPSPSSRLATPHRAAVQHATTCCQRRLLRRLFCRWRSSPTRLTQLSLKANKAHQAACSHTARLLLRWWRQWGCRTAALRRLLARHLAGAQGQRLQRTWGSWQGYAAQAAAARQQLALLTRHHEAALCRRVALAWRSKAVQQHQETVRVQQLRSRHQRHLQRAILQAWSSYATMTSWQALWPLAGQARQSPAALASACWVHRPEALANPWVNRALSRAWRRWWRWAAHRSRLSRKAAGVTRLRAHRTLRGCLCAWAQHVKLLGLARAALTSALLRMSLFVALRRWRHAVAWRVRRKNAALPLQVTMRMSSSTLCAARIVCSHRVTKRSNKTSAKCC
ncbi:hypothetical protein QJQ45_020336 [Haematococcus lacustris]|nr:hypothetical protein QJQ45_020336 [Haematococcus lacustris]